MRWKIFTTLLLFFTINQTSAFEIVYPNTEHSTVTSETTYFVGNEKPKSKLKINNEPVKIHKSGGFFFPVNLKYGENIFEIKNKTQIKTYKILRPEPKPLSEKFAITRYKRPLLYLISTDNTPLRSTPVAAGLNRLQNLQKDVPLKVIGEYNEFYKVELARDDFAWVAKSRVKKARYNDFSPAKIISITTQEFPRELIYTIKLSKKVPFTFNPTTVYETNKNLLYFHEQIKDYHLNIYNVSGYNENTYEFLVDRTTPAFGYKAYYDNNDLIIKIKKPPEIDKTSPLKGIKVMIDAGHGGYESGAIGCTGYKEKDINFNIALKLKKHLQKSGAVVIMSRIKDIPLGLPERVLSAQQNNVDIFISIHNNALKDSEAFSTRIGSSTYYYNFHSHELAERIQKRLVNKLNMNNDKVRRESFAVIRNPQSIAVLVEVGYMIKPEDNYKLTNKHFQEKAAKAIKQGLEDYLSDIYE